MPSRSRQRQLNKLAQRRASERARERRRRIVAMVIAGVVALGGAGIAAAAFLGGGGGSPKAGGGGCTHTKPAAADTVSSFNGKYSEPPKMTIDKQKTYVATMKTSCGTITIELDAATAPNTVNSIVFMANNHLYDGTTFHRIAKDFVIQGGDPGGDGSGGPGYITVDTPPKNAQYPVGTIAMAKTGSDPPGASGSQFFIVTSASAQDALAPGGVGQYAIVGHITGGMDVVRKIAALPIDPNAPSPTDGPPAQTVYIEKVTITVT